MRDIADVRGARMSILGGARSGLAVARLMQRRGVQVFVSDTAPFGSMKHAAEILDALGVRYEFGGHTARALEAELVVISPGVPTDAPIVQQALKRGLRVVSEMEVASWITPAPIVAITGTNGKTTTTTLAGRFLEDAKRPVRVAGNIGLAFSQIVEELTEKSVAVLEVSSFQLDHIESFKPSISVLLNITPDHLDRYGHSMENYVASKCRVFENQREGDSLVYNDDDDIVRNAVKTRAHPSLRLLPFSTRKELSEGAFVSAEGEVTLRLSGRETMLLNAENISLRGHHNLYNALAATLAVATLKVSFASMGATLKNFKGVEHRLEDVREWKGVLFVNDSKATNVDSVWYALHSFTRPIVLLLGGRDKGNDYSRLTEPVRQSVKSIVAIGESADKVQHAFASSTVVRSASSMEEAVRIAAELSSPGDVVLLSPACASFDWFDNYEHRGRAFKEVVAKLS